MKNFIDFCIHQHDVVCNQKYDDTLPYSFHLRQAANQVEKFKYLLNPRDQALVTCGAWGHDLIEDACITYNNIKEKLIIYNPQQKIGYPRDTLGNEVAEIIYSCTELRGKNRSERHGPEYIQGLKECRLGLFVKLCDIIANVTYGLMTNSSMYEKYQKEFSHLKSELYTDEFKPIWDYLEKLLTIRN